MSGPHVPVYFFRYSSRAKHAKAFKTIQYGGYQQKCMGGAPTESNKGTKETKETNKSSLFELYSPQPPPTPGRINDRFLRTEEMRLRFRATEQEADLRADACFRLTSIAWAPS